MSGAKVLLVDDEEEFTEILAERMEARGLRVDTAAEGKAALELAEGKQYDAIVLDLAMPGMDGIETLKRLLATNADLQVILLTGHATVQKGVEAMKHGAREVLEKPVDMEALVQKIAEAHEEKTSLVEKRMDEEMRKLLGRKGW